MRISDWSSDVCSSDLTRGRSCTDSTAVTRPLRVSHWCTGLLSTVATLTSGGGGMPAPGAASLLPQAETAMAIIEPSARMASDVRIDARRACTPGAPERTMEGKARGRRIGAIRESIGGKFPGVVWYAVLS